MFKGLDKKDGAELYDTMDEAIARAKMIIQWKDSDTIIMVHRTWVPLWIAHLVQETPLEWVAYKESK